MTSKISAGSVNDIHKDSGQWMIVDIGFSNDNPSCGVWTSSGEHNAVKVWELTFGELKRKVIQEAENAYPSRLNLLLEAPLSVTFNKDGNPTRRYCDQIRINKKLEYRDFYGNAGAKVLIAADHLLRALRACDRPGDVRLFEGFVSFKSKDTVSSNTGDALKLKAIVCNPTTACTSHSHKFGQASECLKWAACIFGPDQLMLRPGDRVQSAFAFLNKDLIPPIIRINPSDSLQRRKPAIS